MITEAKHIAKLMQDRFDAQDKIDEAQASIVAIEQTVLSAIADDPSFSNETKRKAEFTRRTGLGCPGVVVDNKSYAQWHSTLRAYKTKANKLECALVVAHAEYKAAEYRLQLEIASRQGDLKC